MEAQTIARACGKAHVLHLEPEDLVAVTIEAAAMARVPLAGTDWIPGRRGEHTVTETADVVIVGGGIEGAAAAWALSQRGVTDVLVAERNTVGIRDDRQVQRHRAMPLRRQLAGRDGHRRAGGIREGRRDLRHRHRLPADRLRRRRRRAQRRRRCAKAWPPSGRSGCRPRRSTPPRWPGCGRSRTCRRSPRSRWEARGGYGDAYQTAQAFAASARAAGVRIRQGANVTELLLDGDRVTGVDSPTAPRSRRARSSSPPACGPGRSSRRYGSTCPSGWCASRSSSSTPVSKLGRRPSVLRPGVTAVHPARGRAATSCSATATWPTCRRPTPTTTSTGPPTTSSTLTVDKVGTRFPGFADAAITSSYAGLLRRDPGLESGDLARPGSTGSWSLPGSAGTASRSRPRSAGWSPISSSTATAPTRASRRPTSGCPGSHDNDLLKTPYPYVGAGQMR